MRLDRQEKEETFTIFEEIGITPDYAIKEFFRYIRQTRRMPFFIADENRITAIDK